MKRKIPLFIWIALVALAAGILFLALFPWENIAKVTYEKAPPVATIDSIVRPVSPGALSVMSQTQHNGYGYRTIDIKTGEPGNYYYNSPVRCMTAEICPGGKGIAGTFDYHQEGKIFGITRVDLQQERAVTMPQPWQSVQQASWSPDGKFITFIIFDSTVSGVPQLGLWDVEKNTVSLCTKIDAAIYTPKWRTGTPKIGCIAKTNTGDGILSFHTRTGVWDTLLAPTDKLSTIYLCFNAGNSRIVFAGTWEGEKGLYSLNPKTGSVKQLFKGSCREPSVSFDGDTIACIANVDSKDWLVLVDERTGAMNKITPADSVYWPQWVWPDSVK